MRPTVPAAASMAQCTHQQSSSAVICAAGLAHGALGLWKINLMKEVYATSPG